MKTNSAPRIVGWVIRVGIVLGIIVMLMVKPGGGEQTTTDTAVIRSYDAEIDIDRDGNMVLVENLMVDLPAGKHGIFRIFDTADPRRPNVSHPVTVESIEREGRPENYETVGSARGTQSVRIGDANRILTAGTHLYTIVSTTKDVFEPGTGDNTLWWWDVIGQGWQMRIDSATVTAHLPTAPTKAECVRGEDTPCEVTVDGTTMVMNARSLAPFEPVTVRLTFPADELVAPISASSDVVPIAVGIVLGVIAAGAALWMVGRTREKQVGLPALFEPPEGIYPALGVKVLDEIESPYALQATLFDLAERGLLTLSGNETGWDMTVVGDPSSTIMNAAEAGVLAKLGLDRTGATFELRKTTDAGKTVTEAQRTINSQVSVDSRPYLDRSAVGILGTLLAWATLAGTILLIVRAMGGDEIIWPLLIPLAAAAFVLASLFIDRAAWTVRNAAGRDMWSRVGGFSRFLTTDSAETRFDFAHRQDLYPRYLPWALVLGSADAWAQRYREQGVEPPVVPWLIWTGSARNYSMTSMSSSFNSAISSAASTYAASQSSSGGGGFSGGSGGGGGGGGSW